MTAALLPMSAFGQKQTFCIAWSMSAVGASAALPAG